MKKTFWKHNTIASGLVHGDWEALITVYSGKHVLSRRVYISCKNKVSIHAFTFI